MSIVLLAFLVVAADSTPTQRLAALGDLVWAHGIEEDGLARLRNGMSVDRLPDLSEAASGRDVAFWTKVSTAIGKLPEAGLSEDERVSRGILSWQAARGIEAGRFYWFSSNLTPYASPMNSIHQLFGALPVATPANRTQYLMLARQYAGLLSTLRTKLAGQIQRRLVVPQPELETVIPLWRGYRQAPRAGALWVRPERLAAVPEAERTRFEGDLESVIERQVNPAFDSLLTLLDGPYRAAAPTKVGVGSFPGGKDYYRYLVRFHTTLNTTPDAIFQIGQREIDSLTRELDRVRSQTGFKGSAAEFKAALRTDPRFFVSTPEAVGARLEGYAATMEGKIDSLFGRRPRAPYGVARLDPALEPNMTYGYYDAPQLNRPKGIYFYNGSKLPERNLAMAEGLTYHELVPGHHFQFSLQRENAALPRFRQEIGFTAYNEGWGDYASMLGADAGLYRDPYSRAGRLMMEMMLATRLVLDVGLNYYGWPLERARQFMKDHTLETETQIGTETLRYSVDIPGQALAYRMGSLSIRRLRERTRRSLGARWDVRRFHDFVLLSGGMPLDVLDATLTRFVARGGKP